jgi:hypothetical protein
MDYGRGGIYGKRCGPNSPHLGRSFAVDKKVRKPVSEVSFFANMDVGLRDVICN